MPADNTTNRDPSYEMLGTLRLVAAAGLLLQLSAAPAAAEQVDVAGRSLQIEPIAAFCTLDRANEVESRLYGFVESGLSSRLLAYWVHCRELEIFRRDTSQDLIPYILVTAQKSGDHVTITKRSRHQIIDDAYEQLTTSFGGEEFLSEVNANVRKRLDEVIEEFAADARDRVQLGATKFMGVMGRDENAAYFAMIQHITVDDEETVMAAVAGTTEIAGLIVNAIAYEVYTDEQTFIALKERSGTTVRNLIAANGAAE